MYEDIKLACPCEHTTHTRKHTHPHGNAHAHTYMYTHTKLFSWIQIKNAFRDESWKHHHSQVSKNIFLRVMLSK